ncbi:MAG: hypothetical protein ACPGAO_06815 [Flavobacteriaceae bacterium]
MKIKTNVKAVHALISPVLAIFDPVCGCKGVTYGNACTVTAFVILSYEQGSCADNL